MMIQNNKLVRFQSTRLRKPRQGRATMPITGFSFQSTRLRKPRQQKHSKKHKDLDYKYNFYTNISTYLYMINPQNIYVHNI